MFGAFYFGKLDWREEKGFMFLSLFSGIRLAAEFNMKKSLARSTLEN